MSDKDTEVTELTSDEDTTKENENDDSGLDPKTLLAQKKRFREQRDEERAARETLEAELKTLKGSQQKTEEKTEAKSNVSEDRLEAIEFTLKHPEIDSKTSAEILEVARAKGIKPDEAVDLPYFKTYIEKQAEDKASSGAVPTTSRSLKVKPQKPISEMTQEEHKALWEANNR